MKTYIIRFIYVLVILSVTSAGLLHAQSQKTLTLDSCYALAKANYPLIKQISLIEKSRDYSVENASKGFLPQLNIGGQATYQSDVTKIPITLPNVHINSLSKDQYKIYGEINQSLTDAYSIQQQKELVKSNAETEVQKLEVELYKLKDRVNQLYFGILLMDAQLKQTDLLQKDLQSAINKTQAALANGTAYKSSVLLLQAELLKTNQRKTELNATRRGYADMLAFFIQRPVDQQTQLEIPISQSITNNINRPELKLYDLQKKNYTIQNKLITAKNIPKLGLFFQGGYGRPALNVLNNDFSTYYITGLRLNWNVSGFYTTRKERQILSINQNSSDVQKEFFLFNTNLSLKQQNTEVVKYQELIQTDQEIIVLREQLKTAASTQLENGTITPTDYLSYLNASDQARQNLQLHQMQLLMALYTYQTTSGN